MFVRKSFFLHFSARLLHSKCLYVKGVTSEHSTENIDRNDVPNLKYFHTGLEEQIEARSWLLESILNSTIIDYYLVAVWIQWQPRRQF